MAEYAAAVADYSAALRSGLNEEQRADVLVARGDAHLLSGNPEAAREDYSHTIRLDRNNAEAWRGLADIYFQNDQFSDGLRHYNRAIALNPDHVEAWVGAGDCCYEQESYADAVARYDQALALDPEHEEALASLAAVGRALDPDWRSSASVYDPTLVGHRKARGFRRLGKPTMSFCFSQAIGEAIGAAAQFAGFW